MRYNETFADASGKETLALPLGGSKLGGSKDWSGYSHLVTLKETLDEKSANTGEVESARPNKWVLDPGIPEAGYPRTVQFQKPIIMIICNYAFLAQGDHSWVLQPRNQNSPNCCSDLQD